MKNLIRILIKWYIKVKFGWVFNVSSMYQFLMRIGDIYIYIYNFRNFRIAKMDTKMGFMSTRTYSISLFIFEQRKIRADDLTHYRFVALN